MMNVVNVNVSTEEEYQWLNLQTEQLGLQTSACTTPCQARETAYQIVMHYLCLHGVPTIEEVKDKNINHYLRMVRAKQIHNTFITAH